MRVISRYEHRNGFRAIVRAREGQLPFARYVMESPIYDTRQGAMYWAAALIEENADRQGPFAIAIIEPYSGPVSVVTIVD